MQKRSLDITGFPVTDRFLPVNKVHTLIIGSGAAGLNAAVQLHKQGIGDVLIVTEGLDKGTSVNAGSDKQTYYKMSMCGAECDSPETLAGSLYAGGSMHGDLALVEASLSTRAFLHLVDLGVLFPRDRFGQFVGYKTDHDPLQRATSVGPNTSREMCTVLTGEIRRRQIPLLENRLAVSLIAVAEKGERRLAGAVVLNLAREFRTMRAWPKALEIYAAENVIFATGGPGGLYETSAYPEGHTGGIGLALMVGAKAQNLPESQFGLASVKFRWNVSGSYMQVIPRFFSTGSDGIRDEKEFLRPYFGSVAEMNSTIFLKGYEWPFDARRVLERSSLIDLLVHIEKVMKKRRVFLDYRRNSDGFDLHELSSEAYEYLSKSDAVAGRTPIERLKAMNPSAVDLCGMHDTNITAEPLEIAVCAQHNNGGLAGNIWWESTNIRHLFPVGEVNGSHGVYRPGGSALNSGQVGGFRAAEYIANRYCGSTLDMDLFDKAARQTLSGLFDWVGKCERSSIAWDKEREEFQSRMTRVGSQIRSLDELREVVPRAWEQWGRLGTQGCRFRNLSDLSEGFRNLQLCFAHATYLEAILFAGESGVGSRGSAVVLDKKGLLPHKKLGDSWRFTNEDPTFREKVLETVVEPGERVKNCWVKRRPIPQAEKWFETEWRAFRKGAIYTPR
jgi:succinate dehydrogenase/fumarate reductase flavoprotein subunit